MQQRSILPSTEISWMAKRRMMVQIIPNVILTFPSTISVGQKWVCLCRIPPYHQHKYFSCPKSYEEREGEPANRHLAFNMHLLVCLNGCYYYTMGVTTIPWKRLPNLPSAPMDTSFTPLLVMYSSALLTLAILWKRIFPLSGLGSRSPVNQKAISYKVLKSLQYLLRRIQPMNARVTRDNLQ